MEGDVSKRTITVLVILTVVISVLGSLSVMSALADMKVREGTVQPNSKTQGWVGLTIIGESEQELAQASPTTGYVALEIQSSDLKFKLPK